MKSSIQTNELVCCIGAVLCLSILEVQTCLTKGELSAFWGWLYPEQTLSTAESIEFFPDQKISETSQNFEDSNGLEDYSDPTDPLQSRTRRELVEDQLPIDGYDTEQVDHLVPMERYGRRILNKTEEGGDDNRTQTIKELNKGYFEAKKNFENPDTEGGEGGNGTVEEGGGGGNGTAEEGGEGEGEEGAKEGEGEKPAGEAGVTPDPDEKPEEKPAEEAAPEEAAAAKTEPPAADPDEKPAEADPDEKPAEEPEAEEKPAA